MRMRMRMRKKKKKKSDAIDGKKWESEGDDGCR
jgi:hypothetical protein